MPITSYLTGKGISGRTLHGFYAIVLQEANAVAMEKSSGVSQYCEVYSSLRGMERR